MPKTEKVQKVNELAERIRGSEALFIADYRGLTVSEVTELRRSLRASGTKFTVAKNTLLKRAADEVGAEGLDALLAGPTAVAFVDGDPIAAAKGLVDALRLFRTLEIRGGYMEGKVMSSEEARALATIEPREVLLAKIAGALKAETSRAASMFQALQSRFLSVLEAYKDKVPGETEAAADAEAPAEEPAAAAEAEAEPEAAADEPPAEAEAEPASEPDAEPEPEAQAAAEPEPEPEPEPEAEAEPPADAEEPAAEAEPEAEADGEAAADAGNDNETDDASADASEPAETEGKE
ncbi:MAG TPA: 50S ribosomal protein L10 [Actinomycetota bacterium]|nr:50S ribosomal protein L10 [Actinomycetota bacterium]